MMYIYKSRGKHFTSFDTTIGKLYKVTHYGNDQYSFQDDNGQRRTLYKLVKDPYFGVWVRCDFSIYLGLLK